MKRDGHVSRAARIVATFLVTCVAVPAIAQDEQGPGGIRWRVADVGVAAAANADPSVVLATKGDRRTVVQLDRIPTAIERQDLEASGVKLLRYLGNAAYFARVTGGEGAPAAAQAVGVVSAFEIQPAWKLHPMLARGEFPAYSRFAAPGAGGRLIDASTEGKAPEQDKGDVETLALYVIFHPDVDLDTNGSAAITRHGGVIRSTIRSINGAVVWVPLGNLDALAGEDVVQWLEPPLPPMDVVNNANRALTQADIVQAAPYGLDGTGINVMVYDGGEADASHGDFGGRLTVRDSSGLSDHATHVSGTIGGDGAASSGLYRGMAPGVTIQSYGFEVDGGLQPGFLYTDPGDLEADYDDAINTHGAVIANNSIGSNVAINGFPCEWEGDYGATSMLIDAIVRGSLGGPMRIIWANGNERGFPSRCGAGYSTTAPPACAKNHIAVGAVNANDDSMTSFSSWGPTDDGRLKPDVSAPGCEVGGDGGVTSTVPGGGYDDYCGTSMACPTVSGLSALILQDYQALHPGEPLPRNSTLKVLLAHNAVDRGAAGPDYMYGYGSVRVQNTIDFMRGGSFLEDTVDQGNFKLFIMDVPSGTSSLKATLAWDDPPGAVNTIPELVNDLDIVAISPSGAVTHYPWALNPASPDAPAVRTGPDRVNNIEQVVVDSPETGSWTIQVSGYSVPSGPQVFSLAVTPDMQTCSPTGVIFLDADAYGCTSTLIPTVVDCDLNADPDTAETVTINVSSVTEPAGENVLLTETAANSAKFVGMLTLSETDAAGVLQVAHGDTVTAVYNDADDGTGNPAVVQDTATVDCIGPVITNVAASVDGLTAIVTFNTDEPATGTVRYGLSCGDLTEAASGYPDLTSHSVDFSGLEPNTTYFYAVDAEDPAGNLSTDDNGGSCYTVTTPDVPTDFFTEQFVGDMDLNNLSVTLTPSSTANAYEACAEAISALPTDPAGGTPISLSDDDYRAVTPSGGLVSLYGQNYLDIYVGSNGYVTFVSGDTEYRELLANHFDLPRISGLLTDLNPSVGGTVSWRELGDRVAVTWQNVPEFGTSNTNTFQIEMFFDGRIRISWLAMATTSGVAGLSEGLGTPADFQESDLSAYVSCGPRPPRASPVTATVHTETPTQITLPASDDGLPDPPGALTYIVTSLPGNGSLTDPNDPNAPIATVPYTLPEGVNVVTYTSDVDYAGTDGFTFKANDGGTPPEGGDSDEAAVSVNVIDCRPPAPTNPDPPDDVNDVPIDTQLSWDPGAVTGYNDGLVEGGLSIALPGVSGGASRTGPAMVAQGWTSPGRDPSTYTVPPGYTALSDPVDILMLTTGGDPTLLRTALTAFPDIAAADYFDATTATPTLADLSPYAVVVVMTNDYLANPTATGNVLADYVDAGGTVIQSWASFGTEGDWELAGRFVTAGVYEPFVHGPVDFLWNPLSLGNFDADHPIMDGVTALSDYFTAWVSLRPGAGWVADWNNGTPVVATRGDRVVGINIAAFDEGAYGGDVALLFHNAVVWLVEGACPTTYDVYFGTDYPPTTLLGPNLPEPNCDPGLLDTGKVYYWQVVAKNCCGQRSGPVWSFDTGSLPYYLLTLTETNDDRGEVEIDPEPGPNMLFQAGTWVTLTAWPYGEKELRCWKIYDPNFPNDQSHATYDYNNATTIIMNSDMHVHATWKCADGTATPLLPAIAVGLALCGLVSRRKRRRA